MTNDSHDSCKKRDFWDVKINCLHSISDIIVLLSHIKTGKIQFRIFVMGLQVLPKREAKLNSAFMCAWVSGLIAEPRKRIVAFLQRQSFINCTKNNAKTPGRFSEHYVGCWHVGAEINVRLNEGNMKSSPSYSSQKSVLG